MWTVKRPNISSGRRGMVKIGSSATTRTRPPPRSTTPASTPACGGTMTLGSRRPNLPWTRARKSASSILPIFMASGLRVLGNEAGLALGGLDRVHHQHRDRHGPDAARHRGDRRSLLLDGLEIDVADEPEPLGRGGIGDPVDPDVDDDTALGH